MTNVLTITNGTGIPSSPGSYKSIVFDAGYTGTTIATGQFSGWNNITSVTINSTTITSIGSNAFNSCTSLTSINIPDSVTSIGQAGFPYCISLATVTINPSSQLTSIGANAFQNCHLLTSITIPELVTSVGFDAFASVSTTKNKLTMTVFSQSTQIFLQGVGLPGYTNIILKYMITFEPQGLPDESVPSIIIAEPSIPVTLPAATCPNNSEFRYTFIGWSIGDSLASSPYTGNENITLYAVWTSIPSCFNKDTQILCLDALTKQDKYMLIQDLRKGDLVKTYKHGYKQIANIGKRTMINNPDRWDSCMYKMTKLGNMPADLILTGGHSILLDGMSENIMNIQSYINRGPLAKIDDKYLLLACLSEYFEKVMDTEEYTYYHFYLENEDGDNRKQYGIYSNGIMTETTCELSFLRNNYTLL
jgi:hypothetical protein